MNIIAIGINHKTTPIEVREKLFLSSTEQDLFLSELKCNPAILEAFVLSTCNRTEIYARVLQQQNYSPYFIRLLMDIKKMKFDQKVSNLFYTYTDEDAVRHMARVVTGLDSLVLGERQILGQVKEAVERARSRMMLATGFNILSNVIIRAGKKAQTETDIGYGGSSISWAAIAMAEKCLGSLANKSLLVLGAGKMSELALQQVHMKGLQNLFVMNRTQTTGEDLAKRYQGIPVSFYDVKEILGQVDVCICSVGAPHYILDRLLVEKVMELRNQRRLILIDISMPRNIDPQVAKIKDVYLAHIDDLEKVVEETMRKRSEAVACVEAIIEEKVREFYRKLEKVDRTEKCVR